MDADRLLAWLLTYALHATLLLGAVALLTWRRRLPAALDEGLWRVALFGGLLTASLQVALDWNPVGGRVPVPGAPRAQMAATHLPSPAPLPQPPVRAAAPPRASLPPLPPTPRAPQPAPTPLRPLPWLGALWGLGVALAVARGLRARGALRRRLRARVPLDDGPLGTRLVALGRRAGLRRRVRLSRLAGLGSPLAVGLRRPEIVVPERALRELTPAQQEAMLAHELAHHARRDACWQAAARAVAGLFCFQPLNLLALRRLREVAELRADAWAADHTGGGRPLAECLAVVAGWRVPAPQTWPALTMAARGRALERRVARLLRARPAGARWAPLALLPLLVVALAAPAVAVGSGRAPPTPHAAAPAGVAPAARDGDLDVQLAALGGELDELAALLARLPDPPPALTRSLARLRARRAGLLHDRDALRAALPSPEETHR